MGHNWEGKYEGRFIRQTCSKCRCIKHTSSQSGWGISISYFSPAGAKLPDVLGGEPICGDYGKR